MPIAFPPSRRGNPFDRWQWQRGAKPAQQQVPPNLAKVGFPFTENALAPGVPHARRPNLTCLGSPYTDVTMTSQVNPARFLIMPSSVHNGVADVFNRSTGLLRTVFSGISRDSTGVVLGNCTVLLFRTSDNVLMAQTTSDALGAWTIDVMLVGGPFFLVEYKAGAPDVAGTSLNTLTPVTT